MRLRRFGTFAGGIVLPEDMTARDLPIRPMPLPRRLPVPLDPYALGRTRAEVSPGQAVAAGDRLGRAGEGMPVFAPVNATVAEIAHTEITGPEGVALQSPAVILQELRAVQCWSSLPQQYDWRAASRQDALDRLAAGGVTTCQWPLQPLATLCARANEARVDTVIASAMTGELPDLAEHRLLVEHGPEVVRGLAILGMIVAAPTLVLAVDSRLTDDYRKLQEPARSYNVQPVALEPKYPIGREVMLTKVVTRRERPIGGTTLDARVLVLNISACLAAYRWVACGEPPATRVVTIAGTGIAQPGNYLLPFGTPAAHALAEAEASLGIGRFLEGGPMTGRLIPAGAVTTPATSALLSIVDGEDREPTTCIRCGWCTDHCPVRLNVSDLNDRYELGQLDRARRGGVLTCLGCGVCSYVCPARLPLAGRMRDLAGRVRAMEVRT